MGGVRTFPVFSTQDSHPRLEVQNKHGLGAQGILKRYCGGQGDVKNVLDGLKGPSVHQKADGYLLMPLVEGYLTKATPKLQVQSARGCVLWPEVAGPRNNKQKPCPSLTGSEGALAGTHTPVSV